MAHSDDKGLVLPPKLAPTEVAIVPIFRNDTKDQVLAYARRLHERLRPHFSVVLDDDEQSSPGWKFAEWELAGVPVRVELGPKDMQKDQVMLVRRDTGEKLPVPTAQAEEKVRALLAEIQQALYQRALEFRTANTHRVDGYADFRRMIEEPGGFLEAGWCGDAACEAKIKEETKATIRVLPLEREKPEGASCLLCGKPAAELAVFARAY